MEQSKDNAIHESKFQEGPPPRLPSELPPGKSIALVIAAIGASLTIQFAIFALLKWPILQGLVPPDHWELNLRDGARGMSTLLQYAVTMYAVAIAYFGVQVALPTTYNAVKGVKKIFLPFIESALFLMGVPLVLIAFHNFSPNERAFTTAALVVASATVLGRFCLFLSNALHAGELKKLTAKQPTLHHDSK